MACRGLILDSKSLSKQSVQTEDLVLNLLLYQKHGFPTKNLVLVLKPRYKNHTTQIGHPDKPVPLYAFQNRAFPRRTRLGSRTFKQKALGVEGPYSWILANESRTKPTIEWHPLGFRPKTHLH